jgi:UDP-N-acetylmuramoyl-tripeptide--D-alanyl-D-alanine ligase
LAIIAAKELGLSQTQIAKAILQWKPSAGRGSIHVLGDSIFYLDCYNSSPVSLLDAAKCFHRLSQADARPRLFVLGGMAELGQEAKVLHRQCGQQLPLRAGDSVIVWSGEAASYLEGITTSGVRKELADSLAAVHRVIESHSGYIFVKGSRSCTLEKALPAPLQSQISFH